MDEQRHRRRRPHSEPAQPQEEKIAPVLEAVPEELPSQEHQQTHHRRRRHAQEQNQAQAEREKETKPEALIDSDAVFWDPYAPQEPEQPEQKERKRAKPLRALSAVDAIVCRMGDFCLEAIQWIGVGLLFAAGFVAKNVSSLAKKAKPALRSTGKKAALRGAVHTGKRIRREEKPQPDQPKEEVTLVATRPEDYRGMGDRRGHKPAHGGKKPQKRVVRAPKKKASLMYSAAMALFVCVALVSVYMIGSILWRSISTKRLSDSLSQRYSELSGEQIDDGEMVVFAPEATAAPTPSPLPAAEATAEPQEESAPAQPTAAPAKPETVRSTKFHQVGGDALPEMEALYQDNRDLIGWLRMEEILDLPVVFKDNEYYLTRDFYKKKSASGTLFLDENHPFRENAQNLLLHGHNMKDGTMFGRLVQYETNLQFLKNNPFVQYSTLWKKEQYVIFAVLHVSLDVHSPEFFNYFTHHTFSSDSQFENYVRALQNRSVFSIPIDVDPSDALLTLSTCLDEDRLVIVARRVRDGESKSELRHLVQLAARQ